MVDVDEGEDERLPDRLDSGDLAFELHEPGTPQIDPGQVIDGRIRSLLR